MHVLLNRRLAMFAAVASLSFVVASPSGASRAAQVCPSFAQRGLTYSFETLGSGWSCSSAKSWVVKLIRDRVGTVSKNVPLKNGPRGYHCFATPFSRGGRATAGSCITGSLAFPGKGFAWLTK
jgi:hypothetical protein